jgi:hypothetical protein
MPTHIIQLLHEKNCQTKYVDDGGAPLVFNYLLLCTAIAPLKVLRYKVVSSRFLDDIFLSSLFAGAIYLAEGQYYNSKHPIAMGKLV